MYAWVTSRRDRSCHVGMSHVTHEWIMSRMNSSYHMWMSHGTYEGVKPRARTYHDHQNLYHTSRSMHERTCHATYKWVMAHMYESGHIWMSRLTYKWVMAHMNGSCQMRKCTITMYIFATSLGVPGMFVCHDVVYRVILLVCHDSSIRDKAWHKFIRAVCAMTHSHVTWMSCRVMSRMNESWHTLMGHVTCARVYHNHQHLYYKPGRPRNVQRHNLHAYAKSCNTLQHTATHSNTPQQPATMS